MLDEKIAARRRWLSADDAREPNRLRLSRWQVLGHVIAVFSSIEIVAIFVIPALVVVVVGLDPTTRNQCRSHGARIASLAVSNVSRFCSTAERSRVSGQRR